MPTVSLEGLLLALDLVLARVYCVHSDMIAHSPGTWVLAHTHSVSGACHLAYQPQVSHSPVEAVVQEESP